MVTPFMQAVEHNIYISREQQHRTNPQILKYFNIHFGQATVGIPQNEMTIQ